MPSVFRAASVAAIVAIAGALCAPAQAAEGRNGAVAAGLAAGVLGGVILDRTLLNGGQPQQPEVQPVQARPVYIDPQPTYVVRPVRVVPDQYMTRASGLKAQCDDGDTRACIRFGIVIGEHRERQAQWRRQNPDMFDYERN